MEAKELRIGNWVTAGGCLKKVESVSPDGINGYEYCLSGGEGSLFLHEAVFEHPSFDTPQIQPIPLTPEILEGCRQFIPTVRRTDGMISATPVNKNVGISYCESGLIGINTIVSEIGEERSQTHVLFPHIKYLHQLQNLYFALTGEELEVNLSGATASR